MPGFHNDALILSGPAGSQLKTAILGGYYTFWWNIVSGGPRKEYSLPSTIVDMSAGSGELYVEETGRTILGSAGHALELKSRPPVPTDALRIVLVEQNDECYARLKKVIRRRWPEVEIATDGEPFDDGNGVYALNLELESALVEISRIRLGTSIFFFDPLLHIEWKTIEEVASARIRFPLQTGTEFIIFVFTSDWFTGREFDSGESLIPLPTLANSSGWTPAQARTVLAADSLFGDELWQQELLNDLDRPARQELFINEYQRRLLKWFRFVLPLPFVPKTGQLYHLVFCSNYEAGIRVVRDFYCDSTGNPRYSPDNFQAYGNFRRVHPETVRHWVGRKRPVEWKVLWQIIRHCEGGICDPRSVKLRDQGAPDQIRDVFTWLIQEEYLLPLKGVPRAWSRFVARYVLNWDLVEQRLQVKRPDKLTPMHPDELTTRP